MVLCILFNTVGRFVPIYFTDPEIADYFGRIIFILTLVSVGITTFRAYYNSEEDNWRPSSSISILAIFLAFIFFGIITFWDGFAANSDINVMYVRKSDPEQKIVKQYVDLGALGDGNRVVLRRELTPFFKYEKIIDTNTISKKEWVRQKSYNP
jgi:hypothetical protein